MAIGECVAAVRRDAKKRPLDTLCRRTIDHAPCCCKMRAVSEITPHFRAWRQLPQSRVECTFMRQHNKVRQSNSKIFKR